MLLMFCLYAKICPKTEIVGRNSLKSGALAGQNSLKSGIKANTLICAVAIQCSNKKSARGTWGAAQKRQNTFVMKARQTNTGLACWIKIGRRIISCLLQHPATPDCISKSLKPQFQTQRDLSWMATVWLFLLCDWLLTFHASPFDILWGGPPPHHLFQRTEHPVATFLFSQLLKLLIVLQ